jgi:hypothetical protein
MQRGANGYPIKFMVTVGDYRAVTPTQLYFGSSRRDAWATYGQHAPAEYPQIFAIEVDLDGGFRDSKRLSVDWTEHLDELGNFARA